MRKKLLGLILTCVLAGSLFIGCGSTATQTSSSAEKSAAVEKGTKITALFFNLDGDFFNIFDTFLKEGLTELGYEYESMSCNNDSVEMVEQIRSAVTDGTSLLWLWPKNGPEIADACKQAKKDGTLIYTFVEDPGEDARNIFRGSDAAESGRLLAEMSIDWADREYGENAADGSIRTVVITNEAMPANQTRGKEVLNALKQDSRFDLIEVIDCEQDIIEAEKLTENLFSKYADTIDCIVTMAPALGVLAYLDTEYCVVEDPERLGIFGSEINQTLAEYMKSGFYDGSIVSGGNADENAEQQVLEMDALLRGEMKDGYSPVETIQVTIDNLSDFGY